MSKISKIELCNVPFSYESENRTISQDPKVIKEISVTSSHFKISSPISASIKTSEAALGTGNYIKITSTDMLDVDVSYWFIVDHGNNSNNKDFIFILRLDVFKTYPNFITETLLGEEVNIKRKMPNRYVQRGHLDAILPNCEDSFWLTNEFDVSGTELTETKYQMDILKRNFQFGGTTGTQSVYQTYDNFSTEKEVFMYAWINGNQQATASAHGKIRNMKNYTASYLAPISASNYNVSSSDSTQGYVPRYNWNVNLYTDSLVSTMFLSPLPLGELTSDTNAAVEKSQITVDSTPWYLSWRFVTSNNRVIQVSYDSKLFYQQNIDFHRDTPLKQGIYSASENPINIVSDELEWESKILNNCNVRWHTWGLEPINFDSKLWPVFTSLYEQATVSQTDIVYHQKFHSEHTEFSLSTFTGLAERESYFQSLYLKNVPVSFAYFQGYMTEKANSIEAQRNVISQQQIMGNVSGGIGLAASVGGLVAGIAMTATGVGAGFGVPAIIGSIAGIATSSASLANNNFSADNQRNQLNATIEDAKVKGNNVNDGSAQLSAAIRMGNTIISTERPIKDMETMIKKYYIKYGYGGNSIEILTANHFDARTRFTFIKFDGTTEAVNTKNNTRYNKTVIGEFDFIFSNGVRIWTDHDDNKWSDGNWHTRIYSAINWEYYFAPITNKISQKTLSRTGHFTQDSEENVKAKLVEFRKKQSELHKKNNIVEHDTSIEKKVDR